MGLVYSPMRPSYFAASATPSPDCRDEWKHMALRAEAQTLVDEIKQSLALLRRHL